MKSNNPDKPRWKLILKHLTPEGLTLNLGSSQGVMHKWIKHNHKQKVIGIDFKDADIVHNLNKAFPLKDNYASNIIAGEIIEHLYHPFYFLKECNRVLKKGGKLILTTPNATAFHYIVNPRHGYDLGYTPHLYAWNTTMLKEITEMNNFKVLKIKTINHFTNQNQIFRYASKFICYLIPPIKPKLFMVAEKL